MGIDLPQSQFYESMEIQPLTAEQIAINEMKLNMTLDDIIKMSKKTAYYPRKPRTYLNKRQKFQNTDAANGNSPNVQRLKVSKPFARQGLVSHRRSNFQNNQCRLVTATATSPAAAPIHIRPMIRNRMATSAAAAPIYIRPMIRNRMATSAAAARIHIRPMIRNRMANSSRQRIGRRPVQMKFTTQESLPYMKQQEMMKQQQQRNGPQKFDSFCAYMNARKSQFFAFSS